MNLSEITTKCYILALIIRDDDERLLLGDGFFEFTDKLQHFTPNTFQNDVVELQGTDGQLLAGQVRRTAMQSFDGYVGDATVSQQTTEENRRRFLAFFRKKHFYKVIYIFPDGTAIKRQRGYIVDAPSVKEMFQRFPEYHVGLNFEDPNYYEYDEDESGQEIFAHIQEISLSNLLVGGLVWDEYGAVSHAIAWGDYETQTTSDGFLQISSDIDIRAPLSLTHLYGNATQETLSGKNLLPQTADWNQTLNGVSVKCKGGIYTFSGTSTSAGSMAVHNVVAPYTIQAGDYFHYGNSFASASINIQLFFTDNTSFATSMNAVNRIFAIDNFGGNSYVGKTIASYRVNFAGGYAFNGTASPMILHNISTKTDFEPYCGGVPSPNPSYPQAVNTVKGLQTVRITGKNLLDITSGSVINQGTYVSGANTNEYKIKATGSDIFVNSVGANGSTWDSTRGNLIPCDNGETIYFSVGNNNFAKNYFTEYDENLVCLGFTPVSSSGGTYTPTKQGCKYVVFRFGNGYSVSDTTYTLSPIVCKTSDTSYEPYQGQEYAISLGSIELAKIGNYQDYIWNDDGTWKIHKAIGKVVYTGVNEGWSLSATYTKCARFTSNKITTSSATMAIMSDHFTQGVGGSDTENIAVNGGTRQIMLTIDKTLASTHQELQTWLGNNNTTVYYVLATPTDTEITDADLIEQLDHIYSLYGGVNNLWLIPSGGAQGEIGVRFPTSYSLNGSGYEWEEGAGSAQNIVYVEGIDRTLPVWKVVGPANNPTLTNITTGQTISWQSYVPEGQELIIDMDAQTAMLSGANVFAFIEGEWLELQTGQNRLDYSAEGATDPSTIEWNGVVG